ncbi:MAG: DUF3084 domain-containing protein [Desertifilum sp. SIO1I2]|nr:DUF3084 domain-containing protein [Desertifilum sp. SIO1I2]
MTIGIILIVAILVLGGVLATLGDRIGTKVGKARLSLFNLRPRDTAVLITIVTGVLISGSTLGILFATSKPLRRGVFEYDETQRNLRRAREELDEVHRQKTQIENELIEARTEQAQAQTRLKETNQALESVLEQRAQTEAQLAETEEQISRLEAEFRETQREQKELTNRFQQAQGRLQDVTSQAENLRQDIAQLQAERQDLIQQRDAVREQIAQRDQEIAQRDRDLAERDQEILARNKALEERDREIAERTAMIAQGERRLGELEDQQRLLERQVRILERYYQDYQGLRQGNVALLRGQILASGVVRIPAPDRATEVIEALLNQANRSALSAILSPGETPPSEPVIQITNVEVEQLTSQIGDGQDYVVRILSAGNYVRGETSVRVFADAALNQIVFLSGEVVAATLVNPLTMNEEQIMERFDLLVESSKFRARRAGIFGDTTIQIADGNPETLLRFIQQVKASSQPLNIRAVAAEAIYTAGPLKLEFIAIQDNQVLFRT